MIKEVYKIRDFTVISEDFLPEKNISKTTGFEKEVIGFVFYASGEVSIDISYAYSKKKYVKRTGYSSSFFYSPIDTIVTHHILKDISMQKVSLFIPLKDLLELIDNDKLLVQSDFNKILKPNSPFVEGQNYLLNPEMQLAVHKILNCQYAGIAKMLFLESQVIELISHYFNHASKRKLNVNKISSKEVDKLYYAKELLLQNLELPPNLSELSKNSGLNSFKLKTGFKNMFGMPVYKYLQNERMKKAYEILENNEMNTSEVASFVGYNSLGSFSNAFYKKYKIRPSMLGK